MLQHLSTLDVRKSTEPDGLSARFLREVAVEITAPLAHLYNLSLRRGIVPLAWKQSHITPIHNGGSTDDPSNYRLIAVVSVVAKILEKKLLLLSSLHILRNINYSIRIRVHTVMVRVLRTFYWLQWILLSIIMDKNESVCAASLDFRKAFDSLDHRVLPHQLLNFGVSNAVLQWLTDYLTNRTHRVKFNHQYSSWAIMKGGIPQGSALGPLLFLIYMNTLPSKIGDALLLQYADDTTLVCSGTDPATTAGVMNQQLASIYDWLVEHRMQLNVQKSRVMWFQVGRPKLQHPYPQVLMNGVYFTNY